jgi:RND superfamily putative drug exporter
MFGRWGRIVYRHRRVAAVLSLALAIGMSTFAGRAAEQLSAGGWLDPTSDSATVTDRLAAEFGSGKGVLVVLFRGPQGGDIAGPDGQAAIGTALEAIRSDERVAGVIGFAETGDRRFISDDGASAYVLVQLEKSDEESIADLPELRALLAPPAGYTFQLGGLAPLTEDSAAQSERELVQAETISLPIAALVLIFVFGSIVAAGMPLLVAGIAIPTTLGIVYFVAQAVEMSVYVQNVATMLGLALAIDYSLFMVSRFKEELRNGRSTADAVEIMVATAGKAVTFSGIAVALGLAGLLLFEAPALRSFGIGGAIVVGASVYGALTFLPAVLGMLGPRVNALDLGAAVGRLLRRAGLRGAGRATSRSRWEGVAQAVMARPILVLIPVLALLLAAGSPFLRLQQGIPDASVLPAGLESREVAVALQNEFRAGETAPINVLADVNGSSTDEANVRALVRYAEALSGIEGIDRVESPFSGLTNPSTGAPLTEDDYVALYALPEAQRPPPVTALLDAYVRGSTVRLDAISPLAPASPAGTAVIPRVRELDPGNGILTQVGGSAALGRDFLVSQSERIPAAVGVTLLAISVALFLLFGSIAIPVKAVVMTLLSITASFGALVWIFQEGNLSALLGFESPGFTIAGNPIIMFSVLFGLSMDYEVLLLSRIQEAYRRTGDNRASVAEGLAKTAGVITGAALIMVVVFSAFALAESITIKSIGVGMAIAVLIDATIIRVLLVPATMRLMGRWNWWAPGPLGRLADRLGFSHVEDEPKPDSDPRPLPA